MNPTTINRLVAERVMGWKLEKHRGWESWWEHDSIAKCKKYAVYDWNPSHDLNKAMEVAAATIPRLSSKYRYGAGFSLQKWSRWEARFGSDENDVSKALVSHDNPATAICLAALRAVGVPEEEVNRE